MAADLISQTENLLGINTSRPHVELPAEGTLPAFHQRLYELVQHQSGFSRIEEDWLKTKELIPYIDFLTAPRSIKEHTAVLESALQVLHDNRHAEDDDNIYWLDLLLHNFSAIQFDTPIYHDVSCGIVQPGTYWSGREEVLPPERVDIVPENKIVTLPELEGRLQKLKENDDEINKGALTGKWRIGPHSEQLGTIRQAKRLLGPRSVLIAFLEGKESVLLRKGVEHLVFDDRERGERLIDNKWIDFVCVLDPKTGSDVAMRDFYKDIWAKVGLDYYFVGAQDHPLTPRFCNYGRELGTVVLWAREKNQVSTTDIVKEIAERARKSAIT